ncbi:uncharacterized protein J3D65DRAFT_632834 [Phyllosticta citribraziliensis]|uniref:Uncharacterized protein n=1 Tax=Phyllosticta citribraziliensis TaxID=989973 RepID=A0ABR1LG94_9PEZI
MRCLVFSFLLRETGTSAAELCFVLAFFSFRGPSGLRAVFGLMVVLSLASVSFLRLFVLLLLLCSHECTPGPPF